MFTDPDFAIGLVFGLFTANTIAITLFLFHAERARHRIRVWLEDYRKKLLVENAKRIRKIEHDGVMHSERWRMTYAAYQEALDCADFVSGERHHEYNKHLKHLLELMDAEANSGR